MSSKFLATPESQRYWTQLQKRCSLHSSLGFAKIVVGERVFLGSKGWRDERLPTGELCPWATMAAQCFNKASPTASVYTIVKVSRPKTASSWRHPAVRSALSSWPPRQREARLAGPPIYYYPKSLMVNCNSPLFPPRAVHGMPGEAEGTVPSLGHGAASPASQPVQRIWN